MKGRDSMKYLYKITVVIDDDKVLRFQQHDLNAIYKTVRDAFKDCNFKEVSDTDKELVLSLKKEKILSVRSALLQIPCMIAGLPST